MFHASRNQAIAVPLPEPPDWSIDEQAGVTQGANTVTMVKIRRTAPGEFFFLLAKEYTVDPPSVLPPETLVREVFAGQYRKVFEAVRQDFIETRTVDGVTWVQSFLQMHHARLGLLAKVERVTCAGNHVLIVSAEGAQEDMRRLFSTATAWMDGVRFATLGQPTAPPQATMPAAPPAA